MFDELHNWFILGDDLENILSMVNDAAFGVSTDFVIAISEDSCNYKLYDVFNVFKHRGSILNVTYYGDWSIENGLSIKVYQIKSNARSNLYGLTLKAMFFQVSKEVVYFI